MRRYLEAVDRALVRADEALAAGTRWPLLLFAVALALKVVFVVQSADALYVRVPILDSFYYDKTAREIAAGHLLRGDAFFMGPLYPYFLALIYSITGHGVMVARLLQAAGGAATVALTFVIGRRLFRPSAAFAGAWMLVLYGAMTFYESELLMEWMGTLLNAVALLLLLRARPSGSTRRYAAAGAVLGLSALARASILLFAAFALVWVAWGERRARGLVKAAAFAAALAAVMLPATIHNFLASRSLVPVTSNAGVNFYIGNSRIANGMFVPIRNVDDINDVTTREYVEGITGVAMGPSQVSAFWFHRALDDMRRDPARAAALFLRKVALFFNGYEIPQIESFDQQAKLFPLLRVLFLRLWFIVPLGILGMLLSLVRWRRYALLWGFVATYAASIVVFFVTGRYRAQVLPVLCLFAGHALVALPAYLRSLRSAAAVLVAVAALVASTNPRLFALDPNVIEFREQVHHARRLSRIHGYQPALREIDRAIAVFPRAPEGYIQRAIIHKQAGNNFKAIEDYNRALELDPAQPSVHYDLAQALRRVSLRDEAIREYELAIQYDSTMAQAYNNMGVTYEELKRYDDAVRAFRTAIARAPRYVRAYNNLGACYAETGHLEEAVATFEETTRLFPDYAKGYRNLAMACVSLKRPAAALAAMRNYQRLNPSDLEAREMIRKLEIAARADTSSSHR